MFVPSWKRPRLTCITVIFFKVLLPIEPVSFVHQICSDAASGTSRKQSRSVKRLTPMTLMGKATETGLGEVTRQVLAPHFHNPSTTSSAKKVRTFPCISVARCIMYARLISRSIVSSSLQSVRIYVITRSYRETALSSRWPPLSVQPTP